MDPNNFLNPINPIGDGEFRGNPDNMVLLLVLFLGLLTTFLCYCLANREK